MYLCPTTQHLPRSHPKTCHQECTSGCWYQSTQLRALTNQSAMHICHRNARFAISSKQQSSGNQEITKYGSPHSLSFGFVPLLMFYLSKSFTITFIIFQLMFQLQFRDVPCFTILLGTIHVYNCALGEQQK